MKRLLCVCMVFAMLFGMAPSAFAADNSYINIFTRPPSDPKLTLIEGARKDATVFLDLWHYSAGYWKVGNKGSEKITVKDEKMKSAADVSQIISDEWAEFTIPLPPIVNDRIKSGKNIVVEIQPGKGSLDDYFITDSMRYKIIGNDLLFLAKPKFNVVKNNGLNGLAFWKYGINIKNVVPFIAPEYGYNMYSVFGNGASAVQVNGWVNPGDSGSMEGMPAGRIHPTMVADVSGRLKPGNQIYINSVLRDSAGYQIGQGTFTKAGACGLHFDYPLQFTFYEGEAEPDYCTACNLCELSSPGVCTKETCPHYGTPECGCYQEKAPADTTGSCKKVIQWSETKSHTYYCAGCRTKKDGGRYCPGHTCRHVYTYETTLTSKAEVSPSTLKSGYGFGVTLYNTISTRQISNRGRCGRSLSKSNDETPKPPTAAEVRTSWTVKNKEKRTTQKTIIPLVKVSSNSLASQFNCAPNPVSNQLNKLIYTDVALKGTAKKPVKHTITIYTKGGGVNGVEFCSPLTKSLTINGDMYEDDWTVDRQP